MSDYELYGDYNEVEESPKKSGVGFFVKIIAITLCFLVVGFLGVRLVAFNYYPAGVKNIYFTEQLASFYNEKGGDIGAVTQKLRAPYDDEKDGNFFCDNLIVIPELGELQISLRYNTALIEKLRAEYGAELNENTLHFTLRRSGGDEHATGADAGVPLSATLTVSEWDGFWMYRYAKLVFDGIDFGKGDDAVEWIRLDITVDGVERDEPFMVCIYENNDAFSRFSEYELSRKETP